MPRTRFALGLLLTTGLAGSALAPGAGGADAAGAPGIAELLDPAAVARHACGPTPKRRTEAFKPGVQLAAAAAEAAESASAEAEPLQLEL